MGYLLSLATYHQKNLLYQISDDTKQILKPIVNAKICKYPSRLAEWCKHKSHLPCKHEALNSNPSTAPPKKKICKYSDSVPQFNLAIHFLIYDSNKFKS
jgi:hypothetical protein